MTYNSPKQIRRRQQRAEDRPARRRLNKTEFRPITTDEEWDRACDFHLTCLHGQVYQGNSDSAGRHARALVTMAVQRRAYQVMRELDLRSCWKAGDIARNELLNCKVAQ